MAHPIGNETERAIAQMFSVLAGKHLAWEGDAPALEINHRPLPTLGVTDDVMALYQGQLLRFAYQRCLSRLQEM